MKFAPICGIFCGPRCQRTGITCPPGNSSRSPSTASRQRHPANAKRPANLLLQSAKPGGWSNCSDAFGVTTMLSSANFLTIIQEVPGASDAELQQGIRLNHPCICNSCWNSIAWISFVHRVANGFASLMVEVWPVELLYSFQQFNAARPGKRKRTAR